ncbi:hypothetical protein NDU88_004816 [Pleurodeles waltl]|uniref:Uncharacterized protein n=1 Tax=Pleurodeles waltl TaxID=8319 RepID=A0AAV7QGZ4_PLEWA|nr:hypothetical protein NDU88_004816 [Pleurodeles waltl]
MEHKPQLSTLSQGRAQNCLISKLKWLMSGGIQDGGRISRLIATTALAHPQTTRGSRSPAATDAFRLSGGPCQDRGRNGRHRWAPQEYASVTLAPDPRSYPSRLSAIPAASWQY